jgi:hypothetical protein
MTFLPKFVTVGIFAEPLLPYKSDSHYIFWVSDCSLVYPAYKAHALYYIVICGWLVLPCISTLSHKRLDFRGLQNIKCVFLISSTAFVWNISHSKQNSASYCHKCTQFFMWSPCYSCRILIKHEFSRHFFEKFSNVKFHKNPSSGSWIVA